MPTPLATPVGSRRGSMEDLQAFAKAAGVGMTPVGTPAADIKVRFSFFFLFFSPLLTFFSFLLFS